jgi:subtilase family serine protease
VTESKKFIRVTLRFFLTVVAVLTPVAITPYQANGQASGHVVRGLELAEDQGRVDPEQEQNITVFLKLHGQAGFDQAVAKLYDPASPSYHHWFTDADFARYAPTHAEMQTVKKELESHGLSTISIDPQNFSIRVHGTASAIENAFQTELHTFKYKDTSFQAARWEGRLSGAAGDLVATTAGLERHTVHPTFAIAKDPETGQPLFSRKITATETAAQLLGKDYISEMPLTGPTNILLRRNGIQVPSDSIGHYFGPMYAHNFTEVVSYSPARLQSHYGLTSLIQQGYDGSGETIVLLEAYGYAAAEADANAAASVFGLPPLTTKNFEVVYPEGPPLNPIAADLTQWTGEIALDIQSAHAIAPGAKIIEVASSGQDNEDQITSLEYIRRHRLGHIVSCSFENDAEIISGPDEENAFNNVLERLAAAGISVQFASGDSGDLGLGSPLGAVSVPSNSPYATAVGGTSVLNDPLGNGDIVTGWGNYLAVLQFIQVQNPPFPEGCCGGFLFGAGGGESEFFAKPAWQQALPGNGRQVPDVSADADPFTGFSVVVTSKGSQSAVAGFGGTSLATPIFSAIWAIASQYNGKPLGLAAPAVAQLQKGQITDVVDTSDLSPDSLSGTVVRTDGESSFYSTNAIFAPSKPSIAQTNFLAANAPLGFNTLTSFAISFGADTSLTVEPGWDNVTGFGEPNGLPFIQGVTGKTKGAPIGK